MEKEGGKEEGRKREREREGMPDESEWYARSGARSLSSSFVLSLRPGPTHYPPSLESIYPRPRPADRADPIPSLPPSLSLRRGTRWRNRKINNPSLSRRRVSGFHFSFKRESARFSVRFLCTDAAFSPPFEACD